MFLTLQLKKINFVEIVCGWWWDILKKKKILERNHYLNPCLEFGYHMILFLSLLFFKIYLIVTTTKKIPIALIIMHSITVIIGQNIFC